MSRNVLWIDLIVDWLFGNIRTVPQILLGFALLVGFLVIAIININPSLYEDLSMAHLVRLSPYLVGPIIFLAAMGLAWRLLWISHRLNAWFFLLLGIGLIVTSWLGRLNRGGYYNVLMPAYAGLSILFGLGIGRIEKHPLANTPARRYLLSTLVLLFSSLQLISLLTSPTSQIPTQADKEAGLQLVDRIRACPGNVYIPYHTYLAVLAGKDGYAGYIEMGELIGIFRGERDPLWYEVQDQIQLALDTRTVSVVIQDGQIFPSATSPDYIETRQVFDNQLVFWTVTGWKIRPEVIYEPIDAKSCFSADD
jgi:hypothetical protein